MNDQAFLLQHYCGADSMLELCREHHEKICESQSVAYLSRDFHLSTHGLSHHWAKLIFLLEKMYEAADGALFIWLDHDALIVRNECLRDALPSSYDFGAVRNRWLTFNTGVMFFRNNQKTRAFLDRCIRLGPAGINEWEHDTVNFELSRGRVKVIELPSIWNSYKDALATSSQAPIIRAWHNEDKRAAAAGMRAELQKLTG